MYACLYEIRGGFLEGVCTPSDATAHSYDPPPPRNTKTGAPLSGLRPKEGQAPRYRGRCPNLG
jgi:hypothetical protein